MSEMVVFRKPNDSNHIQELQLKIEDYKKRMGRIAENIGAEFHSKEYLVYINDSYARTFYSWLLLTKVLESSDEQSFTYDELFSDVRLQNVRTDDEHIVLRRESFDKVVEKISAYIDPSDGLNLLQTFRQAREAL